MPDAVGDLILLFGHGTDGGPVHRWLYEQAKILHRDLSPNNIMSRTIKRKNKEGVVEEKLCGVLTDFDLSSRTKDLVKDYMRTSQQRTGTPPYMAHGLLDGSDDRHLYRHDLESLFYIMLIIATHYEIELPTEEKDGGMRTRDGKLPYQRWFDEPSYEALASFKLSLFTKSTNLDLSPSFKDFDGWLIDLCDSFLQGFLYQRGYNSKLVRSRKMGQGSEDQDAPTFDDETLGGHVGYSTLINPVRELKGELEGLVIRYKSRPSTSARRKKARR